MNVLVFNCGSSSLKYKLISMPSEKCLAGGEAQRVGPPTAEPSCIFHRTEGKEELFPTPMRNHAEAFAGVMSILEKCGDLRVDAVGHRVVHGGEEFTKPTLISKKVFAKLRSNQDLAPLHNPPAIDLIEACRRLYPNLPQIAVFDTAFHRTIPDYAYSYALPEKLRVQMGIRKYGFHGISHQYVAEEAAKLLRLSLSEMNAVSCHLGSGGASLCAIIKGRSVDNTMGFSPLQGLVMSTRSGDLDPALPLYLLLNVENDAKSVEALLNRGSGVLGTSGFSADIRDVLKKWCTGSVEAQAQERIELTAQIYLWRIRKYLGAYLAVVEKPHVLIFTDTIGETVPDVRRIVCTGLETFGVHLDNTRNAALETLPGDIATDGSPVRILVVQTNEELAIARSAWRFLTTPRPQDPKANFATN